jgi:Zn-dependent protease with chaperone function
VTTTFLVRGIALALASFAVANAIASLLVIWIARRPDRHFSSAVWFALRTMPALAAAVFVAFAFVPSYWHYEPRDTNEGVDVILTTLAVAGFAMIGAGAARGVSAWWRARVRTRVWMQSAREISLRAAASNPQVPPTFLVDADAPIMALVGLFRPRLLITRGLVAALTEEELAAAVAHELGHARARDNFKRLAMRAAPDLLVSTAAARAIEREWVSAAEHAADRMCGESRPSLRYALASALVKVARLIPPEPLEAMADEPISMLISDGEIASRVRVLLDDRVAPPVRRSPAIAWLCAFIALAVLAATYQPLLHGVHELTEVAVHALP